MAGKSSGPAVTRVAKLAATAMVAACAVAVLGAAPATPALAAKSDRIRPELKTPPPGTRVDVIADRLVYDGRTEVATATGEVYITYGRYVLVARKVVYDRRKDSLTADGEVRLTEPGGNVLEADIAQLRNKFRDGFAEHLRLLLTNDSRITAVYATRRDGYLTIYDRVTYTACNTCTTSRGTPVWQIKSREVTHDEQEATIYHRDATFEFLGLPVFYLPYLSHPDPTVKRRSGFLIPTFAHSSDFGFGVEVPYFWNLAPNYDITFRPLLTTEQGPMPRAEWRHRLTNGSYDVDVAGIYQLKTSGVTPPGDRHWRGYARSSGDFRINDHWTWGWDGTLTSDDTFARRYDLDSRTEIQSDVHVTGLRDRNYFDARAIHFKGLLASDDNSTFPVAAPFIRHNYLMDQAVLGGEFGIDTTIYSLYRDTSFTPYPTVNQGTHQTRTVIDLHWQRRMIGDTGTIITPFARLRSDLTVTENLPGPLATRDEVTARILPTAGIDVRMPFVRGDRLGQHVLTPVAQIIAATNETDRNGIGNENAITLNFDHTSMFLHDRFTGTDRFEGGVRANVGLLYSLSLPTGGFARISGGQSFHFKGNNSFTTDSGLEGQKSDLVGAIALQPTDFLTLTYQARLDERTFEVHSMEAGASVDFSRLTASVNYVNVDAAPAYGRPFHEEQIWGTADLRLGDGWSLFGGLRYDLKRDRPLQNLIGIAYDCDCANIKLYYKEDHAGDRDAKADRTIMLSVQLRTLGSTKVGSGI